MQRSDIFEAARTGDSARAALLLDDPDLARKCNADGDLALHLAALGGHRRVAALLLDAGANVDARNPRGATALTLASARGHLEVVSLLMARGASPPIPPASGCQKFLLRRRLTLPRPEGYTFFAAVPLPVSERVL